MYRIVAVGLLALTFAGCERPDQPPVATEPAAAAAGPAGAAQPADVAWQATQDRYRQMELAPTDPVEALEWRAVLCGHMAGEFGGDNSERDRELNARMEELRCGETLAAEVRALRAARAGDPAVAARLDAILANTPT